MPANEVFTSLRLCASACQTNALSRLVDTYSRPVGYDLAIGSTPCSRVRYGYDVEGRIATLVATNTANRGFQVSYLNEAGYNYGYTLTTPNGAILTRTVTRDPYRRSLTLDCTTRFNNVVVASFAYSFDAGNRPVKRNADTFTYNVRDEILSAVIGTNTINHAYDTIGNHVFCAFNSVTNFYANNQLNQTTASYACVPTTDSENNDTPSLFAGYDILSTNKLTWSAQGGLQRDGRFIYAFDAEDQLVSVTSSVLSNGAIRVVNAYDYRHRRISKTVYKMQDDSPPTSPLAPPLPITHRSWHLQERHDFVYDDWNLIHETVTSVDANSTTNVTEIEYFWGPDLFNTLQGAGGVGGLLAVSMNGAFYFPVYDNLGNIVKYLDETGAVVAAYGYDDFGCILFSSGALSNVFSFRFSTKYCDSESDLYFYGYRFYSFNLCCWINRDPLGELGGKNVYSFVGNQVLSFVDVVGLMSVYPVNSELGTPSYSEKNDLWMGIYIVLDKTEADGNLVLNRNIKFDLKPCKGAGGINNSRQNLISFTKITDCKARKEDSRPFGLSSKLSVKYPYFEVVRLGSFKDYCGTLTVQFSISFTSNLNKIEAGEKTTYNLFGTLDVAHDVTNYKYSGKKSPYSSEASANMVLTYKCNDATSPNLTYFMRKGDWGTGPVLDRIGNGGLPRSEGGDSDAPQAHLYELP